MQTRTSTIGEGPMGRSMLLVPTKVTGLGGSPDPTAVSFRGGAKRVHVWKPGPVSKRGGDHLHTLGIDFHKIFFHPPFSFSLSSSSSSILRLALSASPSSSECSFDLRLAFSS